MMTNVDKLEAAALAPDVGSEQIFFSDRFRRCHLETAASAFLLAEKTACNKFTGQRELK